MVNSINNVSYCPNFSGVNEKKTKQTFSQKAITSNLSENMMNLSNNTYNQLLVKKANSPSAISFGANDNKNKKDLTPKELEDIIPTLFASLEKQKDVLIVGSRLNEGFEYLNNRYPNLLNKLIFVNDKNIDGSIIIQKGNSGELELTNLTNDQIYVGDIAVNKDIKHILQSEQAPIKFGLTEYGFNLKTTAEKDIVFNDNQFLRFTFPSDEKETNQAANRYHIQNMFIEGGITLQGLIDKSKLPQSESGQFEVVHDTGVRLDDVGGVEQIKDLIKTDILDFIKNPEPYTQQGAKMPKGVLLYGPPGTGKTYLAKAIAGEAGVPFIPCNGSDFVEKYVGTGAQRVRELFKYARDIANSDYNPSGSAIVFIDEFDALAKDRNKQGIHEEAQQTVNALLSEMDGLKEYKTKNGKPVNIIVLAATNFKDGLDAAAIREGRFSYKLEVPNPSRSKNAREKILEVHSRNKKFGRTDAESAKNKEAVIKEAVILTKGMSGAQIEDVINKAALAAAKRQILGKPDQFITIKDLREAKFQQIAGPIQTSDADPWQRFLVAGHECSHALVGQVMNDMIKAEEDVLKAGNKDHDGKAWAKARENEVITHKSRSGFLAAVVTGEGDNPFVSFDSLIGNIGRSLASHVFERKFFGTNLSGVSQDLKQTTSMIEEAVTKIGLGPNTGPISINETSPFVDKAYGEEVSKDIKLIRNTGVKVANLIVDFHRDFIEQYADKFKDPNNSTDLTGEDYAKKLHDWQTKYKKPEDIQLLNKKIRILIDEANKGNTIKDEDLDTRAKKELEESVK